MKTLTRQKMIQMYKKDCVGALSLFTVTVHLKSTVQGYAWYEMNRSQLFKASITILWNSLGNKRETKDNFRTFFPFIIIRETFKDLLCRMKLSLITIIKQGFLFKYNPLTLPIT